MNFKSLLAPVFSLTFAALTFAGVAEKNTAVIQPDEIRDPLGIAVTAGYDSHYVYRGVLFAENLLTANVDGNFALNNFISLNVGAWYGMSANDSFTQGGAYQELDVYAALFANLGAFTAGLKYQHYFFLENAGDFLEDIDEIGVLLSTTLGPVDVIAGAYYDATAEGFYFDAGLKKSIALTDRISLEPIAVISYGLDYYGVNGFNHIKLGLSLPIKLTENATLKPYIEGNIPIDALKALGEEDRVYGGISLTVSF